LQSLGNDRLNRGDDVDNLSGGVRNDVPNGNPGIDTPHGGRTRRHPVRPLRRREH